MILVTGGTGFVGQEVVKELLALGYRVRLLVRDPQRAGRLVHHPQIELVKGDALHPETLPAAMTDVQAVIHLIGIIAETSKITFEQGHVEATRNVLTAAKEAGVTRWLQMSACGTRPQANSRYHLTKWQAEERVRQSGLDWTIFRPSLIYGYDERDRLLNLLRRLLSWPIAMFLGYSFPLLEGGRTRVQPVSVREVARCFAHAVAKEASIAQTYDLVGPVPFTWREMVGKIATDLGQRTRYEALPMLLILRALFWLVLVLTPLFVFVGLAQDKLGPVESEIVAGLWVIFLIVATKWRQTLIFGVPAAPLLVIGQALNAIAPRGLQMSEQLKMAVEDNIGDPQPAMKMFGYIPETFEQGLKNLK